MKIYKSLCCVLSTCLLVGCDPKIYQEVNHSIDHTQSQLAGAKLHADHAVPPVVIKSGFYVSDKAVSLQKKPKWLTQKVTLQADQLPIQVLMSRLFQGKDVVTTFDYSVQADRSVSLDYSGTVEGALDDIANATGYVYQIEGSHLIWSAYQTKVFNISFMPGASNYLLGRGAGSSSKEQVSTGTTSIGGLDDHQYNNLQGRISVWRDLAKTLRQLKSPKGKVEISESTTSVTVHDHPSNVAQMQSYIDKLNHSLSQEVAIKVQVLDVELDKEFNYGINWGLVSRFLHNTYSLQANMGTATNLALGDVVRSTSSALAQFQIGRAQHGALLEALSKQGRVSTVTQPQVITLNNQIASIRITRNTGYIASVSSTSTANAGSTSSITPGNIESGFTLYVLPKIKGKKVYMQISSKIAQLVKLDKVSNEPTENPNSSATVAPGDNTPQYQAIEVPTLTSKSFNQRSVVGSGTTLVIAGYQQLNDRADNAKLFGVSALGGKGSESTNEQTLILITPIILQGEK